MTTPPSETKNFRVSLKGRDELQINIEGNKAKFSVIGCSHLVNLVKDYQAKYKKLSDWPLPDGTDHSSMLLRELLLKVRGQWYFPYEHAELCHCRAVPTELVDQAIVAGAHTPEIVSRQTSASTACGTCRSDVEKILKFRLGNSAQTDTTVKSA